MEKNRKDEVIEIGKNYASFLKLLKNCESLHRNPVDNAYLILDISRKMDKIARAVSEKTHKSLAETAEIIRSDTSMLTEQFRLEFGIKLDNALKAKNFTLKGRYPNFVFSFYTLNLDFERGEAKLFFGPELLNAKIIIDVERIIKAIEEEHQRITARAQGSAKFFNHLERACRRAGYSGKAPIGDVHREIVFEMQPERFRENPRKDYFVDYDRALFAYDMFRLREEAEMKRIRLYVSPFDLTREKKDFLWVPDNDFDGSGTRYSYISIEEKESDRD